MTKLIINDDENTAFYTHHNFGQFTFRLSSMHCIGNSLFDSTLNLIYKQAPARGDATGLESKIADNIYRILYNTPDSEIGVERKLDIVCLAVYFGLQNAEPFENRIKNKYMANDSAVLSNIIYLLPIVFTRYDNRRVAYKVASKNRDSLEKIISGMNSYYVRYFNETISKTYDAAASKDFNNNLLTEEFRLIIYAYLLKNKDFMDKYPCFQRFLQSKK